MRTRWPARYREGYQPGLSPDWRRTIDVLLYDPQFSCVLKSRQRPISKTLGTAAIADGELIRGIGREEAGDEAEPIGEGLRGKKRILAFAQLGVVEVDGERKLVDGDRVGEGRFEKTIFSLLIDNRFSVDLICLSAVG